MKTAAFSPALILCLAAFQAAPAAPPAAQKPANASPLNKKLTNIQMDGNSLWDVMMMIRENTGVKVDGAWRVLEEAGVTRASKVNLKIPSISVKGLVALLCHVLEANTQLSWAVNEEGQILITTHIDMTGGKSAKLYTVKDLGLAKPPHETQAGLELITRFVPEIADGASVEGTNIVISAFPEVHDKIDQVLRYVRTGMTEEDWSKMLGALTTLRACKTTLNATWQDTPFFQALDVIVQAAEVPIVVSRQALATGFDPNTPVQLTIKDATPEKALAELIAVASKDRKLVLDVVAGGEVVWIIPADQVWFRVFAVSPSPTIASRLTGKTREEIVEKVYKGLGDKPWVDQQGNRGDIALIGPRFICRQGMSVLCRIAEAMDDPMYRECLKKAGVTRADPRATPAAPGKTPATPAPSAVHAPSRPTSPAASQPAPAAPAEAPAATKLRLAKTYLDAGLKAKARQILQSIVDEYPGTLEAKSARTLLADE